MNLIISNNKSFGLSLKSYLRYVLKMESELCPPNVEGIIKNKNKYENVFFEIDPSVESPYPMDNISGNGTYRKSCKYHK